MAVKKNREKEMMFFDIMIGILLEADGRYKERQRPAYYRHLALPPISMAIACFRDRIDWIITREMNGFSFFAFSSLYE